MLVGPAAAARSQDSRSLQVSIYTERGKRDSIRDDIEARCWNPTLCAYTQTPGGTSVDASLLLMSWYRFCAADHARLAPISVLIAHVFFGALLGFFYVPVH